MRYIGSKSHLSKEIAPIIQSFVDSPLCEGYIEPFVGGANMIDKIQHGNRIGCDTHPYLIALLKQMQNNAQVLPETYDEKFYYEVKSHPENYENWLVGLVGFSSFGAKWWGGFPRGFKNDRITPRDSVRECINNLRKQAPHLSNITFMVKDFRDITVKNYVIYADPPYKGTTKYATSNFPYEEFYDWCRAMSKNNVVLVSEYAMPSDFKCIWEKEVKVLIDSKRGHHSTNSSRREKLFILGEHFRDPTKMKAGEV